MAKRQDRTTRALRADDSRRSKQDWERGLGAPKKGNPRYVPEYIIDKNGVRRKVYVLHPDCAP